MYSLIDKYIENILSKSTPAAPYWNLESIRQGKKPHFNYIDGCMISALIALYKAGGAKKYLDFADNFIDYYVFDNGTIRGYSMETFNIDDISEGRVLFDLYAITGKEKYRKAIDTLYRQVKYQPRTLEGSFWHKLIYPHQVWLDGLYMGQVFYTRYETEFNGKKNYSDIIRQFKNVREKMFDEDKKLYYHGYDSAHQMFWADERGLSKNFWLRSIGWFACALIDVISYIQDKAAADELKKIFAELIEGVAGYIEPVSGMLYQVVDKAGEKGNYLETSGSAMISYAMLKGARLKALDAKYRTTGKNMFDGICKKYLSEKDGEINLGGICLVAGLGPKENLRRDGSYEYYISEPVVENDAKGLGPFVMAYTELKNL